MKDNFEKMRRQPTGWEGEKKRHIQQNTTLPNTQRIPKTPH